MSETLCTLVSDLHLRHTCPIARAEKSTWYDCMARYLGALRQVAEDKPIILAGDLFHTWNSPPELINFALKHLPPNIFAIPGQHDLPNHNYADIKKSAYWTLVEAGKIENLPPATPITLTNKVVVVGYPWDCALTEAPITIPPGYISIAAIHAYVWHGNAKYQDAPKQHHIASVAGTTLRGYDIAAFGDNHKSFRLHKGKGLPEVVNCGGFMRQSIDQKDDEPASWKVTRDDGGTIKITPSRLVNKDQWVPDAEQMPEAAESMKGLTRMLEALETSGIDFQETLFQWLSKTSATKAVRQLASLLVPKEQK